MRSKWVFPADQKTVGGSSLNDHYSFDFPDEVWPPTSNSQQRLKSNLAVVGPNGRPASELRPGSRFRIRPSESCLTRDLPEEVHAPTQLDPTAKVLREESTPSPPAQKLRKLNLNLPRD